MCSAISSALSLGGVTRKWDLCRNWPCCLIERHCCKQTRGGLTRYSQTRHEVSQMSDKKKVIMYVKAADIIQTMQWDVKINASIKFSICHGCIHYIWFKVCYTDIPLSLSSSEGSTYWVLPYFFRSAGPTSWPGKFNLDRLHFISVNNTRLPSCLLLEPQSLLSQVLVAPQVHPTRSKLNMA